MLELLAGATGGLSVQDVVARMGISDRKARQVLNRMVEDQRLHVDKGARRNLYYAPQTTPAGLPLPSTPRATT